MDRSRPDEYSVGLTLRYIVSSRITFHKNVLPREPVETWIPSNTSGGWSGGGTDPVTEGYTRVSGTGGRRYMT